VKSRETAVKITGNTTSRALACRVPRSTWLQIATQSRKPRVEKMMPTFLCGARRAVTLLVVITDLRFLTLNVTG
jgi:hypothetical protein